MNAQTFVDCEKGLQAIRDHIGHVIYNDAAKAQLATDAGMDKAIAVIQTNLDTIRELIAFDAQNGGQRRIAS